MSIWNDTTRDGCPTPHWAGHGRLPRLRHTAAALGYPALRFSLRDPATIGYKKIAAAPRRRGTFPSVVTDQPELRGVSWKAGGVSGCSVTTLPDVPPGVAPTRFG